MNGLCERTPVSVSTVPINARFETRNDRDILRRNNGHGNLSRNNLERRIDLLTDFKQTVIIRAPFRRLMNSFNCKFISSNTAYRARSPFIREKAVIDYRPITFKSSEKKKK